MLDVRWQKENLKCTCKVCDELQVWMVAVKCKTVGGVRRINGLEGVGGLEG